MDPEVKDTATIMKFDMNQRTTITTLYSFLLAACLLFAPALLRAAGIVSVSPTVNAQEVDVSANITVSFDAVIPAGVVTAANFRVSGAQSGTLAGVFTGEGTSAITFNPTRNFKAGEVITVTLTTGVGLTSGYTWQFTVASVAITPAFVTIPPLRNGPNTASLSVYPADMDNDGDIDIVAVSAGAFFTWYENVGTATLTPHVMTSLGAIASVHTADMDGDGDIDILVALSTTIDWLENTGASTFTPHTVETGAAKFVRAADMDNDGDMDVVAACEGANKINWYENNGAQIFTIHEVATGVAGANNVAIADLDNDGDLDIMSSKYDINNVTPNGGIAWYENIQAGGFTAHDIFAENYSSSVIAVDMDHDGDMDVLSMSQVQIFWHENTGPNTFTTHLIVSSGISGYSFYSADMDGDGDLDLLTGYQPSTRVYWYENNGIQTFTQRLVSTTGGDFITSIFAADLDNDGDQDMITGALNDGRIAWYANNVAPVIAGAVANQPVEDYSTVSPFSTITVTDRDAAQRLLTTVQLDNGAKGSFTAASLTASGFISAGLGSYTFIGTAAAAQAALRLLVFAPTTGRMAVGNTETVQFTITVNDQISPVATNNITTVIVTAITPPVVNNAPAFTRGADVVVNEDDPTQGIAAWATNLSTGPAGEAGQTLEFLVSNNNTALFTTQPAITHTGTLTFQPAPNAFGTASVTVVLKDNGGTANGGIDQSAPVTFVITVNPVNDAPLVDAVSDQVATEGVLLQFTLTGLHPGPGEDHQTLTIDLVSETAVLNGFSVTIHGDGTATVTLRARPSAPDNLTITLAIRDNGGTDRGGDNETLISFNLTIEPNDSVAQNIFLPTLFSPNGDGANDVFRLRGEGIADIRFSVYSADGHEVFRTTDITEATETGWNGRYQGRDMPAGAYTWTLQGRFTNGSPLTFGKHSYGQVVLQR